MNLGVVTSLKERGYYPTLICPSDKKGGAEKAEGKGDPPFFGSDFPNIQVLDNLFF